jgi:hypothetical protein
MRKALDVGESQLEFGQDLEHALGFMFGSQTFRNLRCLLVRTIHDSNRLPHKHESDPPDSLLAFVACLGSLTFLLPGSNLKVKIENQSELVVSLMVRFRPAASTASASMAVFDSI